MNITYKHLKMLTKQLFDTWSKCFMVSSNKNKMNEKKLVVNHFIQIISGGEASGKIGFECPMQVLKNVGNFFSSLKWKLKITLL